MWIYFVPLNTPPPYASSPLSFLGPNGTCFTRGHCRAQKSLDFRAHPSYGPQNGCNPHQNNFVPPHINKRYIDSFTSEKRRLPGFFRDSRHQEARQLRHKMYKGSDQRENSRVSGVTSTLGTMSLGILLT